MVWIGLWVRGREGFDAFWHHLIIKNSGSRGALWQCFLEMDARKRRRAFWLSSEETRERETEGEGRETEMTNESAIYTHSHSHSHSLPLT